MAVCPRCNAENRHSRTSCWNCWFPLPQEPVTPAPPFPPASTTSSAIIPDSESQTNSPVVIDAVVPAPHPAITVEGVPSASPGKASRSTPTASAPRRDFAFVADSPVERERGGINWLLITLLCLTALLVAAILGWHYTFQQHPPSSSPAQIAQDYLSTLVSSDIGQQQQLADDESKATLFPTWFVVETARITGQAATTGRTASIPISLRILPSPYDSTADTDALRSVFLREYRLDLKVHQGSSGWRVDQRAFIHQLKTALLKDNPDTKLPAWE